MTVQELIEILECYDPERKVKIATQPSWPLEGEIANVSSATDVEAYDKPVIIAAGEMTEYSSKEHWG